MASRPPNTWSSEHRVLEVGGRAVAHKSGRGLEARAHQAVGRGPRGIEKPVVTRNKVLVVGVRADADMSESVKWAPPGEPKIMRKSMLKRGTQKGGPKGENKWLDVHLEWAGAVQTLFATFHENSKYHRKGLYFGSHFRSFVVPVSSLFP